MVQNKETTTALYLEQSSAFPSNYHAFCDGPLSDYAVVGVHFLELKGISLELTE